MEFSQCLVVRLLLLSIPALGLVQALPENLTYDSLSKPSVLVWVLTKEQMERNKDQADYLRVPE